MKGRTTLHFGFRWGAPVLHVKKRRAIRPSSKEKEKEKENKMKVRREAPHLKKRTKKLEGRSALLSK
jgi:hypothetical protein